MKQILVAYGSLTGNTQMVAERIADACKAQGHQVTLKNLADTLPSELPTYHVLLLGASTWDDGQLQLDAEEFVTKLKTATVDLSATKCGIFGCGDSSYLTFCEAVPIIEQALITKGSLPCVPQLKIDGFPEMPENIEAISNWSSALNQVLV